MSRSQVVVVLGTRPEAIKLAPVILELRKRKISHTIISTGQHQELLQPVLDWFGIKTDIDLALMKDCQSLYEFLSEACTKLPLTIQNCGIDKKISCVIVQGDTTTALAGGLATFYNKIPLAHIEAGLRSQNKFDPFPEEMNRRLISELADFHFCPSEKANNTISNEGLLNDSLSLNVGNTVLDSLKWTSDKLKTLGMDKSPCVLPYSLVTLHRRESFGEQLRGICKAISEVSSAYSESFKFIITKHPNPNISLVIDEIFSHSLVTVSSPMSYPEFVNYLSHATFVITDSGGVQEEAGYLGIPTLVCRNATERPEVVEAGVAELVGKDKNFLTHKMSCLISYPGICLRPMQKRCLAYGNGDTAKKIVDILEKGVL